MKNITTIQMLALAIIIVLSVTVAHHSIAAESTSSTKKEQNVYKTASLKNFAKTYWRFSKFDISDNVAIDRYMKINECDLYNEYIHNEFEWDGIREATRNFLSENKSKFPDKYMFIQPVSLGEYDFEKKGFNIAEEHAFKGVKRFEIISDELNQKVCGDKHPIPEYPKAIALELTRPMIFDFFPVDEGLAKEMIAAKMEVYEKLHDAHKTRENYLEARNIYLIAKVKMFAYKRGDFKHQQTYNTAKMLGILERIEVYEDKAQTNLLFAKDYRRKKKKKKKDF